jgi:hypothetical protein
MNAFWAFENFEAFIVFPLLPAEIRRRKILVKNGPISGAQTRSRSMISVLAMKPFTD